MRRWCGLDRAVERGYGAVVRMVEKMVLAVLWLLRTFLVEKEG